MDRLPAGRRVLYRGHELLNLAVAGEGFRNRVIASWEGPARMEAPELTRRGVDYVVERREPGETGLGAAPPAEGWVLEYEGQAGKAEWRIWRRAE